MYYEQEFATPADALAHHGIKGQKWGVRKNVNRPQPVGLVPNPITKTTKNGDSITLSRQPVPRITKFIARHSIKFTEKYNRGAFLDIKDKSGKTIGNMQLFKRNKDELYVNWIDIDQGSRGRGYAATAMKAAEEFARQNNLKKMTLEVPGISPDARHIYEAQGFKVTKEPTARERKSDPVWGGLTHMELDLTERR